jgi:hypothetical protein
MSGPTPGTASDASAKAFGEGKRDIQVRIDDRHVWTALELATGVLQVWIQFFERHGVQV